MAQSVTARSAETLPGPVLTTFHRSMVSLPSLYGRLRAGALYHISEEQFRKAVDEASNLPADVLEEAAQAGRVATSKELERFIRMLIAAWPNVSSQADLAGYGVQLAGDVEERRPSLYALDGAGRRLRQTMRFLPSICEVLEAIDAEEKKIVAVLQSAPKLPEALDEARRELASRDRKAARYAADEL